MNTLIIIMRGIVFGAVLINLCIWLSWYIKNKEKKDYAVAPMLFSLHGIIFIILTGLNLVSREVYILWRDLLSLHGLIIMISVGVLLIKTIGGKK
jgi:hypothetical protein